ncbi:MULTISPECIES: hypothetical protein [Delftia]|uniref:hypothetical protein n=1 Tax=Delftia TaxID=80865 RepID=UPI000F83350B|nr:MULTISPECIES: hypothetical protein [Delftia]WEM00078.1 hypothetical protein PW274_07270 [Delftia tsuruhatensis]
MARIRTIKPEFFTSEDIVSLSPLARLFYVSLWCEADREGRLEWKPKTFKLRYLPGDNCDVDVLGTELTDAGLVVLYEIDGKTYAEIPTFAKHQIINNRESESLIPARVHHASTTRESGRKEGKEGKERNDASRDLSLFDAFWKTYPKKVGKDDARKAFDKRKPDQPLVDRMLKAVETQAQSEQWLKDGGQYIPNPATWLNQGRWDDEPVLKLAASGGDTCGRFV